MNKLLLLTGSAACLLSTASNVSAITIDITAMNIGTGSYVVSGELTSIDNGLSGDPFGNATGTFFSQPWYAGADEFFDDTSGSTLHYEGIDYTTGEAFDYAFTLSEGQIAWGMRVVWGGGNDHPALNIMDCGAGNPGDTCTGIGTPMLTTPFPGFDYSLSGVVLNAVPVPAAIWLLGSGLLGLIGFANRKVHT